jgi:hypothetical protein
LNSIESAAKMQSLILPQDSHLKAVQKEITTKVMLSGHLMALQKKMTQNPDPELVKQAIDRLGELFPETFLPTAPGTVQGGQDEG